MLVLILGLALFLGMHSISIIAFDLRESARLSLGVGGWRARYSVVSLTGFGLARRPPQFLKMAPDRPSNDVVAVSVGLACYGLFVGWIHLHLFGVPPLG